MYRWVTLGFFLTACAGSPQPKPALSTVYLPPATGGTTTADQNAPPTRKDPQPKDYRNRPPASEEDRARAEVLFREGRILLADGNYAEACIKLEQSMDADPALGTLMNLADCRRQVGDTAKACSLFSQALEWAKATNSADRERYLVEQLSRLHC